MPPRELAETLARRLADVAGVAKVDVAGPGFLNIVLDAAAAGELARTIVEQGAAYGDNSALAGHVVNLEFVSANPTGPLHIGHTRWAALGDSLRRLLAASGAEVTSEYYVNDAGAQMDNFAASVLARAKGEPVPENGYPGEYVDELAKTVLAERPDLLQLRGRRGPGCCPRARLPGAAGRDPAGARATSACTSTCGSASARCTTAGRSRPPSTGCASRATSSTPTARCGCAPPTSATTRTACWSARTAWPRTSPPTPRTT